ncbi:LysR family transcriptional regulator [Myxococcus sp. CA051A]|uniref:LysR family transcriptional regulator n=2 Tax=Myxococcaceae TaxID=31 RepID=A0A540WJ88_9BACT|nr:LysR family transcriptional regulator [Myxococcus sp. CA040A]NTX12402.1 LysR family transcriptional regulator [Myxococcus sp. CA056]NTX33421.1 LysR family transcriptional regulator [Myxococcus sp. CA033]NTX57075.1 LysR family transcriptional regulator [Myxococcus sp. CA039A]NTX59471.1 LysR family transcriptional regulator [Myxococcus sp. CA051A]TQF08937.1 LysR family transcriptional regulator [Myxococcus llanfairpwllgwyngyllgogerychwyrndrobwllllantysiliogogogochensis]
MRAMNVTLEQARALDALARHGTFAAAAQALGKGHTAVLYTLRTLEGQTELELLDRRGYRTRLTPAGERVLEHCRKLLAAERELEATCAEIRAGWEPTLRIVFDGVFPAEPLLRVVKALRAEGAGTRFHVSSEFLAGVEAAFVRDEADLMVSVLPPSLPGLRSYALPELKALLVAHRSHPLARRRRGTLQEEELSEHLLLTVRGSDPRLQLSTVSLEMRSTVHLNDFAAKKAAILEGLGYGWLPEHLASRELRRGELKLLKPSSGSTHAFLPKLHHRAGVRLGRAARRVVKTLTGTEPPQ